MSEEMKSARTPTKLKLHNVAEDLNIPSTYIMHIKAWHLPALNEDLHIFDNDSESDKIFREGLGSLIASEIKEGIEAIAEISISDLINLASTMADIPKAVADKLSAIGDGLKSAGVKLKEYSHGQNANKKNNQFVNHFVFPIPESLIDSVKHSYSEDTFTPLESAVNLGKWIGKKLTKGEGIARISEAALNYNIHQAKRNNFSFDNNLINVYKNTEQRQFIFNITLVPQSYEHFIKIAHAYATLKILMTGEKVMANMGIVQKHVFTVSFDNDNFTRYMTLNDTVELNLETLELDVSGSPFTTFVNGSVAEGTGVPKLIQLILTFKERRPLRDDKDINKPLDVYKPKETKEVKK